MIRLLPVLGVACALLTVWLVARSADSPESGPEPAPDGRPVVELELTPPSLESTDERDAPAAHREAAEATGANLPEPAASAPPVEIRLRVVEEEGGLPVGGAEVGIRIDGERRRSDTDENGVALLAIDAASFVRGAVCVAWARTSESTFQADLALEREMVLRLPPRLTLHGRLETVPASTPDQLAVTYASGTYPGTALETGSYLPATQLDREGRFRFALRGRARASHVRLSFGTVAGYFGHVRVPLDELTSDAGAVVVLELASLVVEARDGAGALLGSAVLHTVDLDRWDAGGSAAYGRLVAADGEARWRIRCQPGRYALCAGAEGRVPSARTVEVRATADPTLVVLELLTLRADERVRGRVVSFAGEPVEAVVITAALSGVVGEAAIASHAQTLTGADGHFELPWSPTQRCDLYAFHRDHGYWEMADFVPGTAPLEIRLPGQGKLRLRLRAGADGLSTHAGMRCVVIDAAGEAVADTRVHDGSELSELTAGWVDVFVMAADGTAFGHARAEVRPAERGTVEITLARQVPLDGRVLTDAGAPAAGIGVRGRPHSWPDVIARLWCRAVTDRHGRFTLPAAGLDRLDIVLSRAEEHLGEATLVRGTPNEIPLGD